MSAGRSILLRTRSAWPRSWALARPKVAVLAAIEKINVKDMPATTDAAIIAKMDEAGQFGGSISPGPMAWTSPFRHSRPKCKHISGPVAGCADIFICPDINSANIFYKVAGLFCGPRDGQRAARREDADRDDLPLPTRSLTKLYTIAPWSVVLAGDE